MSLSRAEIEAFKEELRLQGQACEGYALGVVAALLHIITKAAGIAPADLAGLSEQALWGIACKAHAKRPDLVHQLPDTIPLSRGEFHAVRWGLEKKTPDLPIGKDIIELTGITHGPTMARCLYAITYPLAPRMVAQT